MLDTNAVGESLVHHIWDGQHFSHEDLHTTDGRAIQIMKSGFWNRDAGPDFVRAEVIMDGVLHTGDVEIHVNASEWQAHGHHTDSKYNNVIIHVVLWDDAITLRMTKQDGKKIPTVVLYERLDESIGKLLGDLHEAQAESDDCRVTGMALDQKTLTNILDSMGQERFVEKTEQFQQRSQEADLEQLLYEGIMEASGYAKNRNPFLQLAQLVPFADVAGKNLEEIQALLFGVAGLLPKVGALNDTTETDEYIARLRDLWSTADEHYKTQQMQPEQWRFFRLRPSNFPTRRIAGISQILTTCTDGSLMLRFLPLIEEAVAHPQKSKKICKKLWHIVMPKASGYWAEHSILGGKCHKPTSYLIGKERAADILVNIVLPVAAVWSHRVQSHQLTAAIQRLYDSHPKLQDNVITTQVIQQIFADKQTARSVINTAKRQQGLIYLYKMFCSSRICDVCPIIAGQTS